MDIPLERSPQACLQGVQLLHGAQQNGGEDSGETCCHLSCSQKGWAGSTHSLLDAHSQAKESTRSESSRDCAQATWTTAKGLGDQSNWKDDADQVTRSCRQRWIRCSASGPSRTIHSKEGRQLNIQLKCHTNAGKLFRKGFSWEPCLNPAQK